MGKTFTGFASLAAVALMTTACLVKDTTQTIYLEPDGSVTWTVLQKDVRSDSQKAEDRAREEGEFVTAVRAERHPVALAFGRLDPMSVRTHVLRAEWPYAVLTQARFARLDWLMAQWVGVQGTSTLERQDGTTRWDLTVNPESDSSASKDKEEAGDDALSDSFEHCRFVLVAGRFTSAVGFELSSDGRVATIQFPDHQESDDTASAKPLHFSLIWTDTEK